MGMLAFLVLGLIAGTIAKTVLPDGRGAGWTASFAVATVGALVGGWVGTLVFGGELGDHLDLRTWFLSIFSGIGAPLIYNTLPVRRRRI